MKPICKIAAAALLLGLAVSAHAEHAFGYAEGMLGTTYFFHSACEAANSAGWQRAAMAITEGTPGVFQSCWKIVKPGERLPKVLQRFSYEDASSDSRRILVCPIAGGEMMPKNQCFFGAPSQVLKSAPRNSAF